MNSERSRQLGFAVEIAREAGTVMKSHFMKDMKREFKTDHTIVTEVDKKINSMVIDAVRRAYPEHNILAEEYSPKAKNSEYTWVCDPIDGTMVYSKGIPMAVFSLALVENGRAIVGVIHDPFQDRMFSGSAGDGASVNGSRLSVSTDGSLKGATVGFAAWKNAQRDIRRAYDALIDRGSSVLMLGSIAHMGAFVASGELSACIHPARMPYDTAAAKVLVTEAGGLVTSMSGRSLAYDKAIEGAVMSNKLLHDKLVGLVRTISEPELYHNE